MRGPRQALGTPGAQPEPTASRHQGTALVLRPRAASGPPGRHLRGREELVAAGAVGALRGDPRARPAEPERARDRRRVRAVEPVRRVPAAQGLGVAPARDVDRQERWLPGGCRRGAGGLQLRGGLCRGRLHHRSEERPVARRGRPALGPRRCRRGLPQCLELVAPRELYGLFFGRLGGVVCARRRPAGGLGQPCNLARAERDVLPGPGGARVEEPARPTVPVQRRKDWAELLQRRGATLLPLLQRRQHVR
mmetsp:Transcript_76109/g.201906  ORF Transcript_76109/g.201906 Transcript_76109/m.201906 type:complete len:250 (+) Transcript_76109:104-853(+)